MIVSSSNPQQQHHMPHTCGTLPMNFQLSKFGTTNSCSRLPTDSYDDGLDSLTNREKSSSFRMKSFGSTNSISRYRHQQHPTSQQQATNNLSASQHLLPGTVTITTKVS